MHQRNQPHTKQHGQTHLFVQLLPVGHNQETFVSGQQWNTCWGSSVALNDPLKWRLRTPSSRSSASTEPDSLGGLGGVGRRGLEDREPRQSASQGASIAWQPWGGNFQGRLKIRCFLGSYSVGVSLGFRGPTVRLARCETTRCGVVPTAPHTPPRVENTRANNGHQHNQHRST